MPEIWVVEINYGGSNWQPIADCFGRKQAEDLAAAPHIVGTGKPVRVRERWKAAVPPQS